MKKSLEATKPQQSRLEWFLTRILRLTLVPERHVLVVKKHGQFERLLEPGYHYVSRWSRTKGNLILTGVRVVETKPIPCRSQDRTYFAIVAKARFFFLPMNLNQQDPRERSILIELTGLPDGAIEQMVRDKLAMSLRTAAGRFLNSELRSGSILYELQEAVTIQARAQLQQLGIELLGGIDILNIIPPERIERRTQEATGLQDLGRTLEEMSPEDRDHLYDVHRYGELGRSGGNVRMYQSDGNDERKPVRDPNYARRRSGNRRNASDAYRDDPDDA